MPQSLAQLIDEITVDACNTEEQLSGFLQVFQDEVAVPVPANVLDVAVQVIGFDLEGDERRGPVARCRHGDSIGTLSLADVCFESDTVAVASWATPATGHPSSPLISGLVVLTGTSSNRRDALIGLAHRRAQI